MPTKNILQKDYTLNQKFFQLKLPLNIEYMIPINDSVRLLSQFVEGIEFFHGYGKRKSPLQRSIEKLEEYLSKFKEYTKKFKIYYIKLKYKQQKIQLTNIDKYVFDSILLYKM